MEMSTLRSLSTDDLIAIGQEYDKDLEEEISNFANTEDFLERIDENASSSYVFKSLMSRVAYSSKIFLYKPGIASLEACQFILENPEIFILPFFLRLMPHGLASEFDDYDQCEKYCRIEYGQTGIIYIGIARRNILHVNMSVLLT
jgi:hypothetical protein